MATVGVLNVDLTLSSAKFIADLNKSAAALRRTSSDMNRGLSSLRSGFQTVTRAASLFGIGLGVTALTAFATRTIASAGALGELAEQLGTTTRFLQGMQFAATQVGISQDGLETGLARLSRTVGEAAEGSKPAIDAFNKLGVVVVNVDGSVRSTEQVFRATADAIQAIPDPARRAAAVVDLFGKSGQRFLTVLSGGAKSVDEFIKRAKELGLVLEDEAIGGFDKAGDKIAEFSLRVDRGFQRLAANLQTIGETIGEALEPALRAMDDLGRKQDESIERFQRWKKVIDANQEIETLRGEIEKTLFVLQGFGIEPNTAALDAIIAKMRELETLSGLGIGSSSAHMPRGPELVFGGEPAAANENPPPAGGGSDTLPGKMKTLEGAVGRARREMGGFNSDLHFLEKGFSGLGDALDKGVSKLNDLAVSQKTAALEMRRGIEDLADTVGINLVTSLEAAIGKTMSWREFGVAAFQDLTRAAFEYFKIINQDTKGGGSFFGGLISSIFGAAAGATGGAAGVPKAGGFSGNMVTGFAEGGRPPVGRPSIVGERGPEWFVPDRPGTIIPNGMGGGEVTIMQSFDFRGAEPGTEARLRLASDDIVRRSVLAVMAVTDAGGRAAKVMGRRRG